MGELEDWRIPGDRRSALAQLRGVPIESEETIRLLEPEELIAYETVYQTIVDCYKIAIGKWRHFLPMEWHGKKWECCPERTLATARAMVTDWIESDAFAIECAKIGWKRQPVLQGCRDVLTGKHNDIVPVLLKQIAKERDARRNREDNSHV